MERKAEQKWQACLDLIRSNIRPEQFQTWFECAKLAKFEDDMLTIKLPSKFYVDKYEDIFYNIFSSAIRRSFGDKIKVQYQYEVVKGDKKSCVSMSSPQQSHIVTNPIARQTQKSPVESQQADFDPQLNASLNFENYCVGRSNRLPFTIAEHIANQPEKPDFNPFFLYGNVGVGKTHLIQAIGIRIKERMPNARVIFLSMRQFQHLYQQAVMKHEVPDFINYFQQMDAILFDDLQELSGKTGTADALFPILSLIHI